MKKLFPILMILAFGAIIWIAAAQKANHVDTPSPAGLAVGDIAPDFKLRGVDGKNYSLGDFPDTKGYIVTFTCNHCPCAVLYEDRLIALHN
jgi:cytochrome oxidase Cu insertion factor (SCO1/SenC/PrrC family)